jgi:hypothetical protein
MLEFITQTLAQREHIFDDLLFQAEGGDQVRQRNVAWRQR